MHLYLLWFLFSPVVEVLTEKNGGAMGVDEVAFLDHHELLNTLRWRVISAMFSSQEVLPGSTTSRSRWLWGRKMSAERLEKKDTVETGAKPYAGKCKHGGKRGTNLESVTSLHSRVKLVRHIPFSSDYRGPKTHPPKNN